MELKALSREELKTVTKQLGRPPRGAKGIGKVCLKGKPVVILTAPVLPDGDVFPTCFWLTCPVLNKRVGQLESEGQIETIQRVVQNDRRLLIKMREAHQDYQMLRQRLLLRLNKQPLSHSKKEAIKKTGVAGTSDLTRVKCLHAHYAHWLATGKNPIGEVVDKKLGKIVCEEECGLS